MSSPLRQLYRAKWAKSPTTNDKDVSSTDILVSRKDILVKRKDIVMWLENLKALKTAKGMSVKQIAEQTGLPERTVSRIFSGDTDSPYVDTLHRIVNILGGSLDSILTDSKAVVGGADTIALQEEIDRLLGEVDRLNGELALVNAENAVLNSKVAALTAENDILRVKLEHKEEIIALHNYYMSRTKGNE